MNGPFCRPGLGKQEDWYDQQLTLMARPQQTGRQPRYVCISLLAKHICCGEIGTSAKMWYAFLRQVRLSGGCELAGKTGHLASRVTEQYSFSFRFFLGGMKSTLPTGLASWEFPTTDFSRCFPVLPEPWSLFKTNFSRRKGLEDCRVAGLSFGQL